MRMPMSWRLCEIAKDAHGKPEVLLHGPLQQWFAQRKLCAHVSVSDEADYATSFCVVEILDK
jgi:holo-[acyl-carrier protein] synthase